MPVNKEWTSTQVKLHPYNLGLPTSTANLIILRPDNTSSGHQTFLSSLDITCTIPVYLV